MSTVATSSRSPNSSTPVVPRNNPGEAIIAARIDEAQSALWRAELSRSLLLLVIVALVGITLWAAIDQWLWSPGRVFRTIAFLSVIAATVAYLFKRVIPLFSKTVQPEYAAYSLEHDLPELRHSLTSYVSLRGDSELAGVRGVVVRSIGARAAAQLQRHNVDVPSEASGNLVWWIGLAGAMALAFGYAMLSPKSTIESAKRLMLPVASIEAPRRVRIMDVTPGDVEVLAGRPQEISARLFGVTSNDSPHIEFGSGFINQAALQYQAETGRHVGAVTVEFESQYRIVAGDAVAGPFRIATRDVPAVTVNEVQITPLVYTRIGPRTSTGGAIVGEENSKIVVAMTCNRPVQRARIEFNPRVAEDRVVVSGGAVDVPIGEDGMTLAGSFTLRLPKPSSGAVAIDSYRVHVWDAAGNENADPIIYPIRIIADLAPEIAITAPPGPLVEVPINSAAEIEIDALDPDYGLKQIEIRVRRGADDVFDEVVWSSAEGTRGRRPVTWTFAPQSLGLKEGDRVQVTAIAKDNRHEENDSPASNSTASDVLNLKVTEPARGKPLPKFDPAKKPDDPSRSSDDSSGGQGGDQGKQGGMAGSGSGDSGKPQPSEQQQSSGGSGKSGDKPPGQEETSAGQQAGDGQGASDSSGDNSGKSGQSQTELSEGKSDPSDGNESSDEKPATSGNPGANPGGKTEPTGAEPATGDQAGEPQDEGQQGEGDAGEGKAGEGQADAQPAGKPQHDGDAFERIRDYVNREQQQQNQSQKQNSPGGPTADQNGQQSGDSKPDANAAKSNTEKPPASKSLASDPPKNATSGSEPSKDGGAVGSEGELTADTSPIAKGDDQAKGQGQGKKPGQSQGTTADEMSPDDAPQSDDADDSGSGANDGKQSSDGKQADGKAKSGQGQQGDDGKGDDGKGDDGKGDDGSKGQDGKGEGGEASDRDPQGESTDSTQNSDPGKQSDGKSDNRDQAKPNDKPNDKPADGGNPTSGESAGVSSARSGDNQPPGDQPATNSSAGRGEQNTDNGSGAPAADANRPPDPVNLDDARQATEMVLDYLETQRDVPDPELLEQLDWTPEELRAFMDRWNRIRGAQQQPGGDAKQIEEALRSLGIRKPVDGDVGNVRGQDDSLRGLQDGGNRAPAPAIHRDAFDAFRRNMNQPR